jgi:hypothetical protein
MLIAAAVCPHPPLLVPEVTGISGPGDTELDRLRAACHQAVAALAAERPDLIAVVGGARRTAEYPPGAVASLDEFGIPFTLPPAAAYPAGAPGLPLSLTIAKWLLAGVTRSAATLAGPTRPAGPDLPGAGLPPVAWWGIAADATTAECLELGERIAALAPRVAVLAMGDGPGRRARGVPGAADAAADRYDERVEAALAAPSPRALAALDPAQDADLFVAGRAAWQVLAGAAGQDDFDAALDYAAAPFEVTYYVASWRRRDPAATGTLGA